MTSTNVPDLLTLAAYRREERAIHDSAQLEIPPPAQPMPDAVQWTASDPADTDKLKASYSAAPPDLQALMRIVHSSDKLTILERSAALRAIGQTTVTEDLCQWCRALSALPYVGVCKFHASRAIGMRA